MLHLDKWRFAVVVFAVGAAASLVWLVVLTGRVNRAEATRVATIEANYSSCVTSIPFLHRLNAALRGGRDVAEVLLINFKEMHRVTPPRTNQYLIQTININRLENAIIAATGPELPVPTRADCQRRRDNALNR